jgi:hypothetical protein
VSIAALPEKLGNCRRIGIEEHAIGITVIGTVVHLGVWRDQLPAERRITGAQPLPVWQDQAYSAGVLAGITDVPPTSSLARTCSSSLTPNPL